MATLFLTRAIDRLVDGATSGADEAELLRRYLDTGDPTAFEHIVRRHARTVLGICRRILTDPHAADDAFQATFLQLVRKARTLHAPGALAAWLYATARRTALRHRRPGPPPQPAEPPASAQDPLDLLSARELLAAIEGEIARLPERYQLPLILCYLDGLSKQEAADRLGLPAGVFRGRLDRGRERLRSALARRGFAPAAALGLLVPLTASASAELVCRTVGICARGEPAPAAIALLAAGRVGVWTKAGLVAGLLLAVGLGVIAAAGPAGSPAPQAKLDPPRPAAPPPRQDLFGDPLPPDALARMGSVRWRHVDGSPWSLHVVPSPTGRLVATVTSGQQEEKRTVRVWDLADGRPVCEFPRENTLSGGGLRFTPDGSQLMFVGSRGVVRFHDPRSGKVLAESKPVVEKDDLQPGGVSNGPYSKTRHLLTTDGRWLVTSDDGKLTLSKVTTDPAATPRRVALERPPGEHNLVSNRFSCDGITLVCTDWGRGSVILRWDVRTGKLGRQTVLNSRNHLVAAVSPDGRRVATWRYDVPPQDVLRVWDTESGAEVVALDGVERSGYGGFAFSPDGSRLVAAKWGTEKARAAVVWDLDRGKVVGRVPLPGWCSDFALLPDGKTLLAYSQMGMLFGTWDIATGRRLSPATGHDSGVRHLEFTPDATTLLSASRDPQAVTAWDAATGKERQELALPRGPSHFWQGPSVPFVLTPGGAVVTTTKGTLVWTDRKTGRESRRVTLGPIAEAMTPRERFDAEWLSLTHDPKTGRPAVLGLHTFGPHPDGSGEETDLWQGAVTLSDAESGKLLAHSIFTLRDGTQGEVVSPDGQWLARSGYEPEHGKAGFRACVEVNAALGGRGSFRMLTSGDHSQPRLFTPDGQTLITVTKTKRRPPRGPELNPEVASAFQLWEVRSGKMRLEFPVPFNPSALAVSPDGRLLATEWTDARTISVRELATGTEVAKRGGYRSLVYTLAFRPDGKALASGHADGTALVWDLSGLPEVKPAADRKAAWEDLASADAGKAYRAILSLAADPGCVAFLRDRVKPAPDIPAGRIQKLVKDLDSDTFATREAATAALKELGGAADAELRARLREGLSAEQRRRIADVLENRGLTEAEPDRLQALRGVEVLERAGSAEALSVLGELAKGSPEARRTREAAGAVRRLSVPSR